VTKTEIVNNALGHLGAAPLTDLDSDTTKIGKLARRMWQPTADECVTDHPWNAFKVRTEDLSADPVNPPFGYSFRFALPADPYCLRVLSTEGADDTKDTWTVEGRYLLADTSTVKLWYLRRSLDTGEWPPLFVTVMEYRMAAKLAYAVTRSLSVSNDMMKLYFAELSRARGTNGQEGPPRVVRASTLLEVR